QYGFRGALVPGVTVYAYLSHPLAEAFGAAWLERGTANVRFLKPIHDGEEVRLAGAVTSRGAKGLTATVTATTDAGRECATLTATAAARFAGAGQSRPVPGGAAARREAPRDARASRGPFGARHPDQSVRRRAPGRISGPRQRRARALPGTARLGPSRIPSRPVEQGA